MKDIATRVGVHVSTVSLALKDSPKIREETKKKVLAAANEMGYRRNPYLSTLMKSRKMRKVPQGSPVIGYITFHDTRNGWKEQHVEFEFFEGCSLMAGSRGYKIEDFWFSEPGMSSRRFSDILHNRGIQGIILGPSKEEDAHVDLDWNRFSPVAIGHSIHYPQLHRVTNNHFLSTIRVMDYCSMIGVRKVGFVVRKIHTMRLQHRWLGAFLAKRRELGMDAGIEPLITDDWSMETVHAWYRRYQPEVIIGPFGSSVGNWLESAGIKVPDDVQLVSLACPRPGHRVTGIYENSHGIGARAVQMVVSMIEHTEKGIPNAPSTVSLEGIWNPGSTVKRPQLDVSFGKAGF